MKLDLVQIQRIIPEPDFSRGLRYCREGRVSDMKATTMNGQLSVSCRVRGSRYYHVTFREHSARKMLISCDCFRFEDAGRCKHIAAAMCEYVMQPVQPRVQGTDPKARELLAQYVQRSARSLQRTGDVRLVPRLCDPYYRKENDYPMLSFQVGRDRLYALRNIENFLDDVKQERTVNMGKQLTLEHGISQFDERSQKLIRILMNEYPQFRTITGSRGYNMGFGHRLNEKNEITITGVSFDRLFDLFAGESLNYDKKSVRLEQKDPEITISISSQDEAAIFRINTGEETEFFGDDNSMYAWGTTTLYRCSEEFRDRLLPLLQAKNNLLQLAREDIPTFCACVLPEIQGLATVEDPEGLLESYLPEECTPCFYFDMEGETLLLEPKFRYGEKEYPWQKQKGETVRRDLRREQQALAYARQYFHGEEDFVLTGEEEIYDFLTGSLENFREQGEVYVSQRLSRRQIPPARAHVGISVSDGVLTLDMDTGEFPAGELEALYQSLLKKRKYHRLADGRFLGLEGSGYETLAEMSHMLQLSPKELTKGSVQMPAFRALYLDSVLSGHEELDVTRDRQFRGMIRNFKSLSESDYAVPEAMEGILRPYQKLGYQWLKTLESCGFGGILADEMGLGKTLQVITYLSTLEQEKSPSLVVCPASLILNWGEEFRKFAPETPVTLIYGTAAERKKRIAQGVETRVWVTSYELLRQDIERYRQQEFYACVLDEGQYVKNQSTLASRAVKAINCRQRFVLTGTPIENRLSELWNLFDFLMPGYLYSHNAFVERLEKPIVKSRNEEAMAQLRRLVQPFLLRRMKADVLKELPPKIEHIRRIPMGTEERKTYLSAVNAAKNTLTDTGKLKILAALTQLRQICCDPALCFENYAGETSKLEACLELCAGMAANGHQILLFSQFTSMLDILRQRLDDMGISSFTLQGSTSKEQRARLVKEFNAGGASVFLISLKAGGTGLNLTAADVVIHYDPWWNLAAQNQATDRAHRIGQRQCVQIYKLIAKDTIEERILDLQDKKAELLDIISGEGGSIMEMSKEELLALLD